MSDFPILARGISVLPRLDELIFNMIHTIFYKRKSTLQGSVLLLAEMWVALGRQRGGRTERVRAVVSHACQQSILY